MSPSADARPQTRKVFWRWARIAGGALILAVLVLRVGAGPFVDGLQRVSPAAVLAVLSSTALTTLLCAWRWCLIARGLGLDIPLRTAVASYYRSQFVNSTLPGGVLGDVDRGVRHGSAAGDVPRAVRSVAWDRAAGQVVQVVVAAVLLLVLPSPVRAAMALVLGFGLAALAVLGLVLVVVPSGGRTWPARALRTLRSDLRGVLMTARGAVAIGLTSTVVLAGHVAVFLIAAHAAGTAASTGRLLPLAMLVLLSMSVPTSIGGWGPREGVAAWSFAAAGLGAAAGVETATVYGVLSLVAVLPGLAVLLVARRPVTRPTASGPAARPAPQQALDGVVGDDEGMRDLVGSGAPRGLDG